MRVGENGRVGCFCQVWVCLNGNFVQMHSGWGQDALGHPLGVSAPGDEPGLFSKANSSFVGTASVRTCWEHPQEGLNPWKTVLV